MDTPSQKVIRLISEACVRYPNGGLRAVFQAIQEKGGKKRSESTFYADFNPNESSQGNLKVADFMAAMEITGEYEALRYMAAYFGFSLIRLSSVEPDAPTVEAEMLQDYPRLVDFHKGCQEFLKGRIDRFQLDVLKDALITDIRETFIKATD